MELTTELTPGPTGGWGKTMALAALCGAWSGMALFTIVALFQEPFEVSELWQVPVLTIAYGTMFAFPLALIGLLVIGLPTARMLNRWSERWWILLVAIVTGGVTGRLLYYATDHAIFFGVDDLTTWFENFGFVIGVTTALSWVVFARRVIRKSRSTADLGNPEP